MLIFTELLQSRTSKPSAKVRVNPPWNVPRLCHCGSFFKPATSCSPCFCSLRAVEDPERDSHLTSERHSDLHSCNRCVLSWSLVHMLEHTGSNSLFKFKGFLLSYKYSKTCTANIIELFHHLMRTSRYYPHYDWTCARSGVNNHHMHVSMS